MADAYECGRYTFGCWRNGVDHVVRWLGPYDRAMSASRVHVLLEHDKLTQSFRDGFERGWRAEAESSGEKESA